MYNCSGLASRFIISNKLEMSAEFTDEGANDIGVDVTLCADAVDIAVFALAEAIRGAANNVVRPPLSIFRRLGLGKFWLSECGGINFISNYW